MTNGLGLLRDAAKGHPGVGSGGVELTFPWNNSGANGDFKGTDPTRFLQETGVPLRCCIIKFLPFLKSLFRLLIKRNDTRGCVLAVCGSLRWVVRAAVRLIAAA